jgi:hypothetical protein
MNSSVCDFSFFAFSFSVFGVFEVEASSFSKDVSYFVFSYFRSDSGIGTEFVARYLS